MRLYAVPNKPLITPTLPGDETFEAGVEKLGWLKRFEYAAVNVNRNFSVSLTDFESDAF
jgi:hypothetical protein